MSYRKSLPILSSLLVLLLLGACQGGGSLDPPADNSEDLAPVQQPGAGVDPELWARLTAELDRVLAEEGTAKRTSAGPTGKYSQVPDLGSRAGGSGTLFEWSYRNQGDYDLNGVVTISDLTPIGIHYEKDTHSSDWQQAQLADGDNNGVVNIADVTPIGQNFGGQVDGYEFQSRAPLPDAEFITVEDYPFIPGSPTTGLYPEYVRDVLPTFAGPAYRVVPYADTGSGRDYGVPSNVYDSLTGSRYNWSTMRGNDRRTSLSGAEGPTDIGETWEATLEGKVLLQEPCVDYMGTIYIGTAIGNLADSAGHGFLYAINSDGTVWWRFKSLGIIGGTAAANSQGRVVFADAEGTVYCLARDGKQIWRRQISGIPIYSGVLLDNSGTTFLMSHTISGGMISSSTLYKLMPDGSVGWSRPTNEICYTPPFYNTVHDICVVDEAGEVYSYNIDGFSTHNFILPDQPDALFLSIVASFGDDMVFGDNSDNLRTHKYDNSGGSFTALGERPATAIAVDTFGNYAFGTQTSGPDPALKLNYYDDPIPLWSMLISGNFMSHVVVDQMNRMYYSSHLVEDGAPTFGNGISCVLPDQTIAWFYPTDDNFAYAPVVADHNLLVCCLNSAFFSGDQKDTILLGIRGT